MKLFFTAIYLLAAMADFTVAWRAFEQKTEAGKMLCLCMCATGALSIFYLGSISAQYYNVATFTNMLCFCLIDVTLLYLLCFFLSFVYDGYKNSNTARWIIRVCNILVAFDLVSLALNLRFGHVATYAFIGANHIPHYFFRPHVGYFAHLALCYAIIAFGYVFMLRQAFRIPRMYRGAHLRILACVTAMLVANLIYLAFFVTNTADISILFYSVLGYALYINTFYYGNRDALAAATQSVLNKSDQAALIYDYRGRLFFINNAAKGLFPEYLSNNAQKFPSFEEFCENHKLKGSMRVREDKARFYWNPGAGNAYSYICDYQILRDDRRSVIAHAFAFTNNTLSTDPLTGFLTEQYFEAHRRELSLSFVSPVSVVVSDLNQLGILNNVLGFARGDDAIKLHARAMQAHFPARTLFVRMHNARLAAICYGLRQDEIRACMDAVNEELAAYDDFTIRLHASYTVGVVGVHDTVVSAARSAIESLKTHKLVDVYSEHSNAIESLTQMLAECDGETEGHVERTRILGDSLAFELGLSDFERDQLSLLCLFHDIGKIGIPSHILNKPGALTPEEQGVMREHVNKGYRIARATDGLEIVAEPILHHHERWDGKGYPDGLQHEAIPILSRIISVVDSFDAMTNDRPYQEAISVEAACKELMKCSGTQFDPYIVDAFVRMMTKTEIADDLAKAGEGAGDVAGEETAARGKTLSDSFMPEKTDYVNAVNYADYLLVDGEKIVQPGGIFEDLTGYTAYDVESMQLLQSDLLFEEDREAYWKMVNGLKQERDVVYIEHRVRCKNGTGRYVYCVGLELAGEEPVTRIVMTDITDADAVKQQVVVARNRAKMSLRRLEQNIQLDPMTSLLNKSAYKKAAERALMNKQQRCVLVMIDVDNFKGINDKYGHPKGDELLVNVADALTASVGPDDLVGRVGGDEFSCLLRFSNSASLAELTEGINAFWEKLGRERVQRGIMTTFSSGAAWVRQGNMDFAELYEKADNALYIAKNGGKNRIHIDQSND